MTALTSILYIEDEPDIQAIATLALETLGGFKVRTCDSGAQALEVLKSYTPQLILLDVMMPGMDGPTTLRTMRKLPQTKNIPVIFMTAKVQQREVDEYKNMGAIGVISKPFDAMKLAGTVKSLWEARS